MRISEFAGSVSEASDRAKHLQSRLKDYTVIAEENLTVNGKNAFRRVYRWTDAAHNINFTQAQTWTDEFLLTATALTEDYGKYESLFERMIKSFRIQDA